MRILVTGGLGFIGSNLIERMCEDHYIYSLDNNFTADRKNMIDSENVRYIYGDTRDIDRIFSGIDIDVIYHLGEYSRIVLSFEDIDMVHDFNVKGTFRVARFCIDRGI